MAFCKSCGTEFSSNQKQCSNCGRVVNKTTSGSIDNGGFGWGLLGFCIPIVGLILYLVWKDEKPNTAGAAGTGALIGFVLGFIVGIIQVVALGSIV